MSESIKDLKKQLLSGKKNGYDKIKEADLAAIDAYCAGYIAYLDAGKTERLCAAETIRLAEAQGYKPY
ncbi:MAG: aminopeptidase, partial [Clostridia bacterium]|nr:aminopeptidase [Clostridia bacterium]